MLVVIICLILAAAALFVVNTVNRIQEQERIIRRNQRKLKVQAESLVEVAQSVEHIMPTKIIAKVITDEAIRILNRAMELDEKPNAQLEDSIKHAQLYSENLAITETPNKANYQQETDAQITYAHSQLNEALRILRQLYADGSINEDELNAYDSDISWANLMVSVTSCIGQAQRLSVIADHFGSKNLYRKAQSLLSDSIHHDPRRLEMITEIGEIIEEKRETMSPELLFQ